MKLKGIYQNFKQKFQLTFQSQPIPQPVNLSKRAHNHLVHQSVEKIPVET